MELTAKQKKILKWAGYPALALFTFVMALHYTFPYDRLKQKAIDALSDKYDVEIMSAGPTILPGGMVFEGIDMIARPEKPGKEGKRIFIDEVTIDASLLGLLFGNTEVDIEAKVGNGSLSGSIELTGTSLAIDIETSALPLQDIPGLEKAVGLPMEGGLDADFELSLPKAAGSYEWREADGHIKLACLGCTVGDGKAKISPKARSRRGRFRRRSSAFTSQGVTVPRLDLGNLSGEIQIAKGKGVFKSFGGTSPDGELVIDAELTFARKLGDSTMPGCMKFKLSDALKKREKDFGNIPALMGVALSADGYANVRLKGKLSELRWIPAKSCDMGGRDPGGDDRRVTTRPTITTKPTPPQPVTGAPTATNEPEPEPEPEPDPATGDDGDEADGPGNSGPELRDAARQAGRNRGDDSNGDNRPPDPAASVGGDDDVGPPLNDGDYQDESAGDYQDDDGDYRDDDGYQDDRGYPEDDQGGQGQGGQGQGGQQGDYVD